MNLINPGKTNWEDEAGFAELFEAGRGAKYDKGEKQFGHPDRVKTAGEKIEFPKTFQAKLDLHGKFVKEVDATIKTFIKESRERGLIFVLIVTGMGRHSEDGESKLRPIVMRILGELKANSRVKDFRIAEPKDGGYGAVYVYLR